VLWALIQNTKDLLKKMIMFLIQGTYRLRMLACLVTARSEVKTVSQSPEEDWN
jgi:hypothetical protein